MGSRAAETMISEGSQQVDSMNGSALFEKSLIAGVGLTHLRVYDQRPGPDGVQSGCAHVHGVTEEAYFGLAGEGCLELHDLEHGFRSVPLRKGTYVQFPPDTLHRSVSLDGLEVLAIMGGAGLAERGDARIYFGAQVDEDPDEYERLRGMVDAGLDGALRRRDASVQAYRALMNLWHRDTDAYRAELRRFVEVHRRMLAGMRDELREVAKGASLRVARQALARVDALPGGAGGAAIAAASREYGDVRLGMCGFLRQV